MSQALFEDELDSNEDNGFCFHGVHTIALEIHK